LTVWQCQTKHPNRLKSNSSVTSVIGPESLLVATFACVGFSRENRRSGFRDFCNTIGQKATFPDRPR
jgi:hypothetical protein